jgi:hypothetical protein
MTVLRQAQHDKEIASAMKNRLAMTVEIADLGFYFEIKYC